MDDNTRTIMELKAQLQAMESRVAAIEDEEDEKWFQALPWIERGNEGSDTESAIKTFTCTLSGDEVTVTAGTVYVHRYATAAVAENTYTLSGTSSCAVSVRFNWSASTAEIVLEADGVPTDTDDALHVVLRIYTNDSGTWTAGDIKHDGDVHVWTAVA